MERRISRGRYVIIILELNKDMESTEVDHDSYDVKDKIFLAICY